MPNPRVVPVPLKLATPSARSLKRLEGAVVGEVVLTNQSLLTLPAPAKTAGRRFDGFGDTRLTVTGVSEANGAITMHLALEFPSPWAVSARRGLNPGGIWPESPQPGNQTPVVKAFDAAGKPMQPAGADAYTDATEDGQTMIYRMTWSFKKGSGVPAKLVVVGTRTMLVEVPFVLENVPLP